ncbi:MAG: F0F1 ATP synthase subunit B [Proteobacteria bacterium]|nr:F0F1 ATP synthase subunit B [Pseudomonadota bacterium]MBU1741485.1 F0F1 ATP synthase subunit B [Pseudomonadota bacterium]
MSTRKLWPLVAAAAAVLSSVPAWAAEAAQGDSSGMWWNLLFRTMNFVVLVAVLWWLLRKPIKNMLGGRRESIKAELEELERAQAEAEQALAQADAKLKDVEARQEEIVKGYVQAGEAEKARIIDAAHQSAGRIKEMADLAISQEIKHARAELMDELAEMSAKLAEDLIKRNIGPDDQKRLVGEYLEKVKVAEA